MPTFVADMNGEYVAVVEVGNSGYMSGLVTATFRVTAGGGNVAPVANAGTAQSVATGTVTTLDGSSSSDANGDSLSYSWTLISKPLGSMASLASSTSAMPTLVADVPGAYVAKLIVNDGTDDSVPAIVSINAATGTNTPPIANPGTRQNVIAGWLVSLDGSASSDANSDPLTYKWTLAYRPVGSSATLVDATTVAPKFRVDLAGVYIAKLVVNDGTVNSPAASVVINVVAGNAPPVANAGTAQNVLTGTVTTLNGRASSDANGDPLTYHWTWIYKPTGSKAVLNGMTRPRPTFSADLAGDYIASLVVNDGLVNSAPAAVIVTATAGGNAVPVANAGTMQNVNTGTLVTLDGSGSSDANGDPITYNWKLVSKPAGSVAILAGETTASPSFTPDQGGAYVATLTVKDGIVFSAPSTVLVNAVPNATPIADARIVQSTVPGHWRTLTGTAIPGSVVTLDGGASSDANGDPLTYNWTLTTVPSGSAAVLSNATSVSPTFTTDADGTYVASLVVNDGKVDSAVATVSVTSAVFPPPGYVEVNYLIYTPLWTDPYMGQFMDVSTLWWACALHSVNGIGGWRMPTRTEVADLKASRLAASWRANYFGSGSYYPKIWTSEVASADGFSYYFNDFDPAWGGEGSNGYTVPYNGVCVRWSLYAPW
jgi:hypothetical protein